MASGYIYKLFGSLEHDHPATNVNQPTIPERILQECHNIYFQMDSGLLAIAETLDADIVAPMKQVSILLLGNHSVGKSSFINWYIGETVQRAGVAIETQGFTFVQHGIKRQSLLGEAALMLLPRFKGLKEIPGLLNFVNMEVSPSSQRNFKMVTLIDSPGLVDGGMEYPYDVNRALIYLGTKVDLVFVFFDPIGQALCKRMLSVLEEISAGRQDGLKFYFSKADTSGSESERQKVILQVVQELCTKPRMNRQGFEMKSIFIPGLNMKPPTSEFNQIEEVCLDINQTVEFSVQRTLTSLEKDCLLLQQRADEAVRHTFVNLSDLRGMVCLVIGAISIIFGIRKFNGGADSNEKLGKQQTSIADMFLLCLSFLSCLLGGYFTNLYGLLHWRQRLYFSRVKRILLSCQKRKTVLLEEYLNQFILRD